MKAPVAIQPVGGEHRDRLLAQAADDEGQDVGRGPVHPLHVIDQAEHRTARVRQQGEHGAAGLLVIQFGLGTAVNLYVTLPAHQSFWSKVSGRGAVAGHAVVALALLGASISALVRSIRARRRLMTALTAVGLIAILVAAGSGVAFVRNGSAGPSVAMALAAAVALLAYLAAIFALGSAAATTDQNH